MDVRTLIQTAESHPAPGTSIAPEYVDEQDETIRTGWRIENIPSAEWALKRQAECEDEISQIEANAKAAKAWIDKRTEQLKTQAQRGAFFFRGHLLDWMERSRNEIVKGAKKSRTLLYGTVGWRSKPERLVFKDEAAALEWAKAQPVEAGFYRVKYELEKDAIQKHFKASGEIPNGCEIQRSDEEPYVKAVSPALVVADKGGTHAA